MIEFNDIKFSYDKHSPFSPLNLKLPAQAITFLLGENGSGKSTVLKLMLGLINAQSGEITINGRNIKTMSMTTRAQHMAYIAQNHHPVFDYSVEDVIVMGCSHRLSIHQTPSASDYQRAHEIANTLEISHLLKKSYQHISGGERQLVLIGKALMQTTNILIMDEPTANLDFGHRVHLFERLQRLSASGSTIILSSHNPNDALKYADHVVLMHARSCLASGSVDQMLTPQQLGALYHAPLHCYQDGAKKWLDT